MLKKWEEAGGDDESPGVYSDEKKIKVKFVKAILKRQNWLKNKDKYNAKNNSTEINKKMNLKGRNLYVIRCDLETRRLRNEQTKAGLVNYADLSKDFEDV